MKPHFSNSKKSGYCKVDVATAVAAIDFFPLNHFVLSSIILLLCFVHLASPPISLVLLKLNHHQHNATSPPLTRFVYYHRPEAADANRPDEGIPNESPMFPSGASRQSSDPITGPH